MTLDDFKDVYRDKTPLEKLKLLIVQTDYIRDDVRGLERDRINGNETGAEYLRKEIHAKEERIQWLYVQLSLVLKALEPRVMSLEEVRNIPYGHVLIETGKADSLRWVDALLFSRNTNFSFDFITLEGRARLLGSEYGREWRCWTSRPTDAQREAEPWQ